MPTSGPGYFEDRAVPDKKIVLDANTSEAQDIPLERRNIFVNGSTPKTQVNLPNVSEAEGYTFHIQGYNVPGAAGAGVLVDFSKGSATTLQKGIETSGVVLTFQSNGMEWTFQRTNEQ